MNVYNLHGIPVNFISDYAPVQNELSLESKVVQHFFICKTEQTIRPLVKSVYQKSIFLFLNQNMC